MTLISIRTSAVFAGASLLTAGALVAQPQFRATVDLMVLDVSVVDRDRRPVRGLTLDDFEVKEDGVVQELSTFREIDLNAVRSEAVRSETVDVALSSGLATVATNEVATEGRLLVLVFDDATMIPDAATVNAMKRIGRRLVEEMGPNDRMAVVFTERAHGGQEFSSDKARLLAAIDTLRLGGFEFLWHVLSESAYMASIRTLRSVVDSVASIEGRRKAVVYVTVGIPISLDEIATPVSPGLGSFSYRGPPPVSKAAMQGMHTQMNRGIQEVFRRARRGNVNIHVADPAGLDGLAGYLNMIRRSRDLGQGAPSTLDWANMQRDYLRAVAGNTGGTPIIDTNGLEAGVSKILEDTASYYLVGFIPRVPPNNKLRRLDVRMKRPGLVAHARSGYYALPPSPAAPFDMKQRLNEAIEGPLPLRQLPLRVGLASMIRARQTGVVAVLGLGVPDAPPGSGRRGKWGVLISALDVNGRSAASTQFDVDLTLRAGAPEYFEMVGWLDVPPGRYHVRVGMVEQATEQAGSVYQDVEVADLRSSLAMSDVVLSVAPGPPVVFADITQESVPLVPTARRVFSSHDQLAIAVQVLQVRPAEVSDMAIRATLTDPAGAVVADAPMSVPAAEFVNGVYVVRWRLPSLGRRPGIYHVTLTAARGKTLVSRSVDIVLQ